MEPNHQNLIRSNYTTLVKKMSAVPVAGFLYASNIITDEMKQQIEVEKTSYDKNRKLISIILRRGPSAFQGLKRALLKANQRELSNLLIAKDDEDVTKTDYEKKLALARSLVVCTKEREAPESQPRKQIDQEKSPEPRCRISLDDFNDIFLTVMPYKDVIYIHIRHFTENNGRFTPTKKGVTFPMDRWLRFESLLPEIQKYLNNIGNGEREEMQWHVGGGVYISLTPGFQTVDIRHYWKPEDAPEPVPTKKGVTLNHKKFTRLLEVVEQMHQHVPELKDVELCMLSESHQNQLGMLNCPECTPFGYDPLNVSMECNAGDLQDVETLNI